MLASKRIRPVRQFLCLATNGNLCGHGQQFADQGTSVRRKRAPESSSPNCHRHCALSRTEANPGAFLSAPVTAPSRHPTNFSGAQNVSI